MKAHEYSNAAAEDLWKSLEEASGKPVVKIMEAWITKAGYPVISASLGSDGIKLKQARFKLAGDEEGKWPVPLTYYLNGDKQAQLMEGDLTIGGKHFIV